MKKILPILILLVTLVLPSTIFATSLEVSKSSSFSTTDLNFSGDETIYVRLKTESTGSSHSLNIRDNNYSIIKSVNLDRSGDTYSASFSVPSNEGLYSLEAKIEGEGVSITSVKTIKVGGGGSGNIKVNVESSVKGEKSQSHSVESESGKEDSGTGDLVNNDAKAVTYYKDETSNEERSHKSLLEIGFIIAKNIWNVIWIF